MAIAIVRNLLKEEKILSEDKRKLIDEVNEIILHEFSREDQLDIEVREILSNHMEKIRRENIEYQTMFKMIKTKLAKEKDIVL
ncbi:MAG: DUF507 family protein [Acidobacteriota bacterium]